MNEGTHWLHTFEIWIILQFGGGVGVLVVLFRESLDVEFAHEVRLGITVVGADPNAAIGLGFGGGGYGLGADVVGAAHHLHLDREAGNDGRVRSGGGGVSGSLLLLQRVSGLGYLVE